MTKVCLRHGFKFIGKADTSIHLSRFTYTVAPAGFVGGTAVVWGDACCWDVRFYVRQIFS